MCMATVNRIIVKMGVPAPKWGGDPHPALPEIDIIYKMGSPPPAGPHPAPRGGGHEKNNDNKKYEFYWGFRCSSSQIWAIIG